MNGTGQKITVFNNLTDDNNFIISIDDVDDVDFNHRNESKKIKHTSSSSKFKRLSQLFKSNSVNSCSVSMSSSSFSSDDGLDMKIIPFFNENSECIICLDKYNDFKLELNPNKLDKFNSNQIYQIKSCKCKFCINCLNKYVEQCIENCDVVPINCPGTNCASNGYLDQNEIQSLLMYENNLDENIYDGTKLFKRYLKLCENIEILRDKNKIYCPQPNCQNVCIIKNSTSKQKNNQIKCEKCNFEFCSLCQRKWSNEIDDNNNNNNENTIMLINKYCDCGSLDKNNKESELTNNLSENFENIKRCPQCSILIERVDGCAQIMCKFCKHCFCFYCLESLDNDFLLKHYTKDGPCKGKLGHSRISLLMHRLSVVAIFSGTIFLVLILSPFILLTLPFLIFSSKCRKTCYKFSSLFN